MPQSIQIIKYSHPLSLGQIFSKLSKKKFKIKYTDQNDSEKKIELEQEIENLKKNNFGIQGTLRYHYQKENEFADDGTFDVTHEGFSFLFDPTSNLVILHGSPSFRVRVMKFFSHILHDGDDLFETITIPKEKLHDLMMKILKMNAHKNNLDTAQFFHYNKPLGNLRRLGFSTIDDYCGTNHQLFKIHYKNCTHWNCTIKIYKCNGILDNTSEVGYLLRLSKDGTSSFTIDRDLTQWNRFVVETMKPILKF